MRAALTQLLDHIRARYGAGPIALHRPILGAAEAESVQACLASNMVSSIGAETAAFEAECAALTQSAHAIAMVNGTAALQVGLRVMGVGAGQAVICPPLTFVAPCVAVRSLGAEPIFLDIEGQSFGLCPQALRRFLDEGCARRDGQWISRASGLCVTSCLVVHAMGRPARMAEIAAICAEAGIALIEDAAGALGSVQGEHHVGNHGIFTAYSFNGNKIITTGGGGLLTTPDADLAARARHLSMTAKRPHPWRVGHDDLGYNHRMPALNAALGRAQLGRMAGMLAEKARLNADYLALCDQVGIEAVRTPAGDRPNHWLSAIMLRDGAEVEGFMTQAHAQQIQCRPAWDVIPDLPPFASCERGDLTVARRVAARLVLLPSSCVIGVRPWMS